MLPEDFPAAVLVVLHIPPSGPTVLPEILSRAGPVPARHPADDEPLSGGVILVAPPDRHLAVSEGRARVLAGPRDHGHRPSADVLLRSAADAFGAACCGVVLSGIMNDGAAGLAGVLRAGGLAPVQDPAGALFPGMPRAAIEQAIPSLPRPCPRWLTGSARGSPAGAGKQQCRSRRSSPG